MQQYEKRYESAKCEAVERPLGHAKQKGFENS